jgi:hypothetical protein
MRRLRLALMAAGLMLAVPVGPALSQEVQPPVHGGFKGNVRNVVELEGVGASAPAPDSSPTPASGNSGPSEPPPPPPPSEPFWGVHPVTGEPCVAQLAQPGLDPESELAVEWRQRTQAMFADPRLADVGSRYCTGTGPVEDPSGPARSFVRTIPVPKPTPEIAPGIAVAGLPAYLVIGNQDGFTVTETLVGFGAMEVSMVPTAFDVDWGDGHIERVDDGRVGVTWEQSQSDPGAAISHIYTDRDLDLAVSVNAEWVANWSVGGFSGVVTGLTTDTSFALPVQEYRAVRVTS